MSTFVVATDSVHISAAICDYLFDRAAEDDTVHAVNSLRDDNAPEAIRDGQDALNAVASRLAAVTTVETEQLDGGTTPVEDIRSFSEEIDADEIVLGVQPSTDTATDSVGTVAEKLLLDAERPIVVVPRPR
ncbi:MAG: universal stress protein UspA related nucleotide-binding protein [Halonotius sp. J07HN4]|jgi:Universal stress protein family.|nr:MAG: universal stress protein UspA related nucleotide-binding protein [Halonotius sp. J07HN4]